MSTVDQEELDELRRLAIIGRATERERAEEAEAKARLDEQQKQLDIEHRIAQRIASVIQHESTVNAKDAAAKQAEDDARIAEAVFKRMKAEEKRQIEKGKENLKKAFGTALFGAALGFYGSLIKTTIEDDNSEA